MIELFVVLLILFVLGITSAVGSHIGSTIKTSNDANPNLDSKATDVYDSMYSKQNSTYDGMIIGALVLLWIGAIALSLFIDTHPVWFAFNIFLLGIALFTGMIFANQYGSTISGLGVPNAFPMTTFVFSHIVGFIIAIVGSILIALYAKSRL